MHCRLIICCLIMLCTTTTTNSQTNTDYDLQDNSDHGYLIFCLCMGRLGNQMEHFLGGLAFAKAINRTLILPPFRTYKNVGFDEWFEVAPLQRYHQVILADDFMKRLAPTVWPPGHRYGFCWLPSNSHKQTCDMKQGNPFGPFWDGLGVDFDGSVVHSLSFHDPSAWIESYPAQRYPVIAMKGAPASFPMEAAHRPLQQYLHFSQAIIDEGQKYITDNFPNEPFIGLHLRNGIDWEKSCEGAVGRQSYMASPQCTMSPDQVITLDMCLPPLQEILRLTGEAVKKTNAKVIFVATDRNPYKDELQRNLKQNDVKVYHMDPWLPIVDVYVLTQADLFIGNCVSSFSSFVTRTRDVNNKPSQFWGL